MLLAIAQTPSAIWGQMPSDSATTPNSQSPAAPAHRAAPRSAGSTVQSPGPDGNAGTYPQPEIVVTNPAPPPAPTPWTLHERVLWGADIILAVLGYVGILLALRTLKIIEHQTEHGAATAQAALDTAQTALEQTQALVRSERPWIAVTVEPFLTMENAFKVMATNRGRAPAKIVGIVDRVTIATNETQLPANPEYEISESNALPESVILLPGESVGIKAFSRDDVSAVCKTSEGFQRIRLWEESIFLHGRVAYVDLIAPADKQTHETDWCCRYIHGEKTSSLVIAGPPDYHKHS